MEKMTKKDYFNVLAEIVKGAKVENEAEILEFLDRQIELLSKKSNVKTKTQKENERIREIIDRKNHNTSVARFPGCFLDRGSGDPD